MNSIFISIQSQQWRCSVNKIVQKFLEHMPEMNQKAKSTLLANCHTDTEIAYFIQYVTEVIDDEDYQNN